jgi:hypothetical protein
LISTQSIPPRLLSEVLSPQIAPLSCLLLPKLSTLVDCCLRWVAQHLQAFCKSLATHCHHIVVVPSLLANCCPQSAAVNFINSVADGGGGGIIAVAIAIAIAIPVTISAMTIAVVTVIVALHQHCLIVDAQSPSLNRHCCLH